MQKIERFFLPIFWEYKPKKNAIASLFLFDEFSYPSQKTTEKGKKRKKKEANAPDTKAFKKRGVVFNHIAKILEKTIPKLFYFTL